MFVLAFVLGQQGPDPAYSVADQRLGAGAVVRIGDRVTVEITARGRDGTVTFDTKKRGLPYTLVIDGTADWRKALVGMRVGGVRVVDTSKSREPDAGKLVVRVIRAAAPE